MNPRRNSTHNPAKQAPPVRRVAGWAGPVLVIAIVAVLAIFARPADEPAAPAAGSSPAGSAGGQAAENPFASLARRDAEDPVARGRTDAPVVIIEYADFQCPFCGRYARETEPRLIREYVDKGLVRIEWRDLPYLGAESRSAAAAARAAAAQGKFWEYHDAIYAEERRVNSGALNEDALRDIASSIGLDLAGYDADRASDATTEAIARDEQEAVSLGITGTPAFIVGDTPIVGAQPYEAFQQVIDEQLAVG